MYCSNCGRLIIEKTNFCFHCGTDANIHPGVENFTEGISNAEDTISGSETLNNIRRMEDERIGKGGASFEDELQRKQKDEEILKPLASQGSLTSKKEQKGRRSFLKNRENGSRVYREDKDLAKRSNNTPIKKVRSRKVRFLLRSLSYLAGIFVFLLLMGYLFFRFAPTNDETKRDIVEWSSENLNKNVYDLLFTTVGLNDYYSLPEIIDYSGTYTSTFDANGEKIFLTHSGMNLSGHYKSDGKEYSLKGLVDGKGEFLLMEILNGIPTAILKGTVFSKGYLTAERFGMNGEKKMVLSLEKDKGSAKISN